MGSLKEWQAAKQAEAGLVPPAPVPTPEPQSRRERAKAKRDAAKDQKQAEKERKQAADELAAFKAGPIGRALAAFDRGDRLLMRPRSGGSPRSVGRGSSPPSCPGP